MVQQPLYNGRQKQKSGADFCFCLLISSTPLPQPFSCFSERDTPKHKRFSIGRCWAGRRPDFNCKTMQEPQRGSQLGRCISMVYVPRRGTSAGNQPIIGLALIGDEVRLRRTIHLMICGPSCEPLRGSCMVLQTNCIFDALCVFDAIV